MNAKETTGRQPDQVDEAAAWISTASAAALKEHQRRCQALAPLDKNSVVFDPTATRASVAAAAEVTERTVYRWLALKEAGKSLLDRPRGGKGKSRVIRDVELASFARVICLSLMRRAGTSKPPIAEVRRRIAAEAEANGWTVPSPGALGRFLQQIPRAHRVYAAGGVEALNREVLPKPPVKWAVEPNVWWCVDHQLAHVFATHKGRKVRPWLTAVRDMFDGSVLAVYVSERPNAWAVGCALRIAIERWGLPLKIYADCGKDIVGVYVDTILRELGVQLVNATGRSPWSKGRIESFFSAAARMFFRFYPGHTGDRPTRKPLPSEPCTMEKFRSDIVTWVDGVFNKGPAFSRSIDGQRISRQELRASVPYTVREPRSKDVTLQLLKRERRRVGPQGISLAGISLLWADELIPLSEERATVEVRYDPADLSRVWVFHRGQRVCVATDAMARAAGATEEDVRQRLLMRRRLLKATKDAVDPDLQAAEQRDTYLEHLAIQRRTEKLAAGGGGRGPVVTVLLPRERTANRPSSVGRRRIKYDPYS